ncbi:hypothetical protein BASA61_003987 [Batrachochytrium salamandrivorans]|nr:hypothetical protein BASA60_003699 [Batrachochytrium salamandrivorans]KAH6583286.1 hypothetical protein BASA61_008090 [Batrachochytrium salamandrivorans]KAH6594635.1 hypothetical protein BASA61_003987 [Batrachochytrium salamandrivorans]
MPPKSSKKQLRFQSSHELMYGLKITARDKSTGEVSSCACRFCIVFGREDKVGAKRKATERTKYFDHFRTDNYMQHLVQQHPKKWSEYEVLKSAEEKEAFFHAVDVPFVSTLAAHFEREGMLRFLINKSIVEVIIGNLMFHPDDVDGCTISRALSLFKRLEADDDAGANDVDVNQDAYVVEIKTPKRFSLVVGCVALGASFCMASKMVQLVRDESGLSFYSGCSELIASNYMRVMCAVSLQILSEALYKVSGFSLALDSSTIHGMSYLDIRIRLTIKMVVYNYHLLAIPLFEQHTGENMFEVLVKFMDALYSPWREILISSSTDGARSMTGRIQGLATRIDQCTAGKLIRIWCGLHQLDLVMQRVFKASLDEKFYSTLTALIGHLRKQQTLISAMRSTCPKVADTRWISMESCTNWLTSHNDTNGRTSNDEQLAAVDSSTSEICGCFALSHAHARFCLECLDLFVIQTLPTVDDETVQKLVIAVSKMFVQVADGIYSIVAERDSSNQPADELPQVLPHQLVKIDLRVFNRIHLGQMFRLEKRLSSAQIHQIGKDFVDLLRAYREEPVFKASIGDCDDSDTDFAKGWKVAGDRFPALCQFCGDLASAFPNTATVESDFSIIGWEKDIYRKCLTDFSLEGILHAKQFTALKDLRHQF